MTAPELARLIHSGRYAFQDELKLQDSLASRFNDLNIPHVREFQLSPLDRIDFMVGTIGIEVKVASAPQVVRRQLWRYAKSEKISELILVTTKSSHKDLSGVLLEKPITVVHLINSFF